MKELMNLALEYINNAEKIISKYNEESDFLEHEAADDVIQKINRELFKAKKVLE